MSILFCRDPHDGECLIIERVWNPIPEGRDRMFVAELTGFDPTFAYARKFKQLRFEYMGLGPRNLTHVPRGIDRAWLPLFRIERFPALLDIRHETRGFYVLHKPWPDHIGVAYRIDEINEPLLRSLLSQRLMLEMEPRLLPERKVPPARQGRLISFDD